MHLCRAACPIDGALHAAQAAADHLSLLLDRPLLLVVLLAVVVVVAGRSGGGGVAGGASLM